MYKVRADLSLQSLLQSQPSFPDNSKQWSQRLLLKIVVASTISRPLLLSAAKVRPKVPGFQSVLSVFTRTASRRGGTPTFRFTCSGHVWLLQSFKSFGSANTSCENFLSSQHKPSSLLWHLILFYIHSLLGLAIHDAVHVRLIDELPCLRVRAVASVGRNLLVWESGLLAFSVMDRMTKRMMLLFGSVTPSPTSACGKRSPISLRPVKQSSRFVVTLAIMSRGRLSA